MIKVLLPRQWWKKKKGVWVGMSALPPRRTVLIHISVKYTPNQEDRAHPAAVLN